MVVDGRGDDDGDGDDDSEDSHDDDEAPDESLSPEDLSLRAKELSKEGKDADAVKFYSHALERKLKQCDGNDRDPAVAEYLLNYGDALLRKEENSSELFVWDADAKKKKEMDEAVMAAAEKVAGETEREQGHTQEGIAGEAAQSHTAQSSCMEGVETEKDVKKEIETSVDPSIKAEGGGEGGGEEGGEEGGEGDVGDLQLAWETLECARIAYKNKIEEATRMCNITRELVMEGSFAHVRLGDLLLLQEKPEDAADEYRNALNMRVEFNLEYPTLCAPSLSLAQCLNFCDKNSEALQQFESTRELVRDYIGGIGGHTIHDNKINDWKLTLREIEDTILDIKRKAIEGDTTKDSVKTAGIMGQQIAGTASDEKPFAEKTETSETVNLGVITRCDKSGDDIVEGQKKRWRVDISGTDTTHTQMNTE
eukprot:GHVR01171188.1.p1 GENE.GHVR01171188.1~~GHVR01171188.1.p1  ORF type:complete len:423 (+),score=161.69 GHVR01171188.1:134-1402(+)